MTNRPEVDPFTEQMTNALHDTDAFAARLRRDMEASLRPVADRVIADAVRPWRRLTFWLGVGYIVLLAVSVVEAIALW